MESEKPKCGPRAFEFKGSKLLTINKQLLLSIFSGSACQRCFKSEGKGIPWESQQSLSFAKGL